MKLSAFDLALAELWAIGDEASLRQILEIAAREHDIDLEAVQARRGERLLMTERAGIRDGVAVVPIVGPIFRYANLFTEFSGGTPIESTAQDLRTAADAARVKDILITVDSPGGQANGTNELAKLVRSIRAEGTRITAYVSNLGASGAYWIASAAERILIDETAQLGSIGVIGSILDTRKRDEARGVRQVRFVSSQSPLKVLDPDSEPGRAALQGRVDAMAQVFIEAVAVNRGVTPETVINEFGQGDVLIGERAVEAGMADGLSSFEEVLADLSAGRSASGRAGLVAVRKETQMAEKMTAADLAAKYPEAAAALRAEATEEGRKTGREDGRKVGFEEGRAEGHKAGLEEGQAEGRKAGADAERERLRAIDEAALPGSEALVQESKADGSSAETFALKQARLMKESGSRALDDLKADAAATAALDPPAAGDDGSGGSADSRDLATRITQLVDEEAKAGRTISCAEAAARLGIRKDSAAAA